MGTFLHNVQHLLGKFQVGCHASKFICHERTADRWICFVGCEGMKFRIGKIPAFVASTRSITMNGPHTRTLTERNFRSRQRIQNDGWKSFCVIFILATDRGDPQRRLSQIFSCLGYQVHAFFIFSIGPWRSPTSSSVYCLCR